METFYKPNFETQGNKNIFVILKNKEKKMMKKFKHFET